METESAGPSRRKGMAEGTVGTMRLDYNDFEPLQPKRPRPSSTSQQKTSRPFSDFATDVDFDTGIPEPEKKRTKRFVHAPDPKVLLANAVATSALYTTPTRPMKRPFPVPLGPGGAETPKQVDTPLKVRQPPSFHVEHQKEQMKTPLVSRVRPDDSLVSALTTPKKPLPSKALRVPSVVPARPITPSSPHELRPITTAKVELPPQMMINSPSLRSMSRLERPSHVAQLTEASEKDPELSRGLMISPDKNNGRGSKYIKNGLAERADLLIKHSKTAFTLWQKALENNLATSRALKPDIRLHVTKVVHETYTPHHSLSHSEPTVRSVLAACQLIGSDSSGAWDKDQHQGLVLFSFPSRPVSGMDVSSRGTLPEGAEVLVWMPWYKVNLSPVSRSNGREDDETTSFSLSQVLGPSGNLRTAHLCSRFLVLPT